MLSLVHQFGDVAEPLAQAVGDLAPAGMGLVGVGLGEDGLHHRADHPLVGLAQAGQQIALKMHAAALPSGTQDLACGGLQALVGVADHQLNTAQAAAREGPQEVGPERLGLGGQDGDPQDLAAPVRVDRNGHDHRHRDDASALAQLHMRLASSQRKGRSPSRGRFRNACTRSSISAHSRETWLLEAPVSPMARTRSSTARVETPWMQAEPRRVCRRLIGVSYEVLPILWTAFGVV